MAPWYQSLTSSLKQNLPRWRWSGNLGNRGGELNGRSQKDRVRIAIEYARGHWFVRVYKVAGHDWILEQEGQARSVPEVVALIEESCK